MKAKKIVGMLFVASVSLGVFVGCGNSSGGSEKQKKMKLCFGIHLLELIILT